MVGIAVATIELSTAAMKVAIRHAASTNVRRAEGARSTSMAAMLGLEPLVGHMSGLVMVWTSRASVIAAEGWQPARPQPCRAIQASNHSRRRTAPRMPNPAPAVDIGVDIGGTFTDIVCRRAGEPMRTLKIPTTRGDPSEAVLNAITHLARDLGVAASDIARFLHGTTIATNAVLERKGAKIGLIASEGFRDILEIGYQLRQDLHRIMLEPVTPVFLAPGAQRKEAREQVSAQGEVIVPLDEDSVRRAAAELVVRRRAGDRGVLSVLLPASAARAAHARVDRGGASGHRRVAVERRRSHLPRIRTHRRHRVRCVHEAGRRPLSGTPGGRAARGARHRTVADHAVARRACGHVRRARSGRCGCSCPVPRPA